MKAYTVYTNQNGNPLCICPDYEMAEKANLAPVRIRDKWTIEFMCTCGCNFKVSAEKRDFYRKRTNLEGSYNPISNGGKKKGCRCLIFQWTALALPHRLSKHYRLVTE